MANQAIAFLQKTSDVSGGSVYDHLAAVVGKILETKPEGAVDLLETTLLVKKTHFGPDATPVVKPTCQHPKDTAAAVAVTELYNVPEAPIDPETGEPEEVAPANEFETENLLSDAAMYGALGVGFSQTEWYSIMLTVKKLGEDPVKELKTVRFFGKIYGVKNDYYVFETTLQNEPEAPEDAPEPDPNVMPPEDFGTGANTYTYFVCHQLGGPITQLPPVTPEQIICAQKLKKFLVGDLKAEVSAYPPFPGVEANYLRAQIARISSTTVLCPNGFFIVGEDEITLEKDEEGYTPVEDPMEMKNPENWAHRYPHIKTQGRCVWWAPPPPEDEEEAENYEEPEPEESPALLSTIDNDAQVMALPAWSALQSSSIASVQYQVVGLRSNLWPGAIVVYAGNSFSNVYIGHGLKNERLLPPPPPAVCGEWQAPMDEEGNPTYVLAESTELPPPPPDPEAEGEEEDEE
eukprot:CAMPEP_0118936424 /NCGR_PEP_ID=MMETSP1169-20130426/18887_1 /TAXON_ID=36882 /ORGANISM="Pyramimonas obovata, Strain CCMP722" /LENGTH=460 /DNA_ID=CAMNT_0006879681 /DNA_START=83 /DNA_END=1465 /DNA_ORIENTATION=+